MSIITKKTAVLLDTNALLLFGQGIDIFQEVERLLDVPFAFIVPELVLAELEKLSRRTTRDGRAAKLAIALVREKERRSGETLISKLLLPKAKEIPLKTVPSSGQKHADDAICAIAEDEPATTVVVTLDKGLQGRLLKRHVRVIGVKQGRLAFIESTHARPSTD